MGKFFVINHYPRVNCLAGTINFTPIISCFSEYATHCLFNFFREMNDDVILFRPIEAIDPLKVSAGMKFEMKFIKRRHPSFRENCAHEPGALWLIQFSLSAAELLLREHSCQKKTNCKERRRSTRNWCQVRKCGGSVQIDFALISQCVHVP